jgi:hypothetical protein
MRLIYLSILAITLSFSMNTFAENPKVNMYYMDKTQQTRDFMSSNLMIICAEGLMFLQNGVTGGLALVQMMSSAEHPMRCPIKEIEE